MYMYIVHVHVCMHVHVYMYMYMAHVHACMHVHVSACVLSVNCNKGSSRILLLEMLDCLCTPSPHHYACIYMYHVYCLLIVTRAVQGDFGLLMYTLWPHHHITTSPHHCVQSSPLSWTLSIWPLPMYMYYHEVSQLRGAQTNV